MEPGYGHRAASSLFCSASLTHIQFCRCVEFVVEPEGSVPSSRTETLARNQSFSAVCNQNKKFCSSSGPILGVLGAFQ